MIKETSFCNTAYIVSADAQTYVKNNFHYGEHYRALDNNQQKIKVLIKNQKV